MWRSVCGRLLLRASCWRRGHQVSPFRLRYRRGRGRFVWMHTCVVCGKRLSPADVRSAVEAEARRTDVVIGGR